MIHGDNDHGDTPVPDYAVARSEADIVERINSIVTGIKNRPTDDILIKILSDAVKEVNALRLRLFEIKLGHEGCCHTCEPVGALNKQLSQDKEILREERDEARRLYCVAMAEHTASFVVKNKKILQSTHEDIARMKGWDCFEDLQNAQ